MSEQFPNHPDDAPRLMEYIPFIDEDNVPSAAIEIDETTRGRDLIATLRYLTPTEENLQWQVGAMLEHGYAKIAAVQDETFDGTDDPVCHMVGNVISRNKLIDKSVDYEKIRGTLENVFGTEAVTANEQILLERLIDKGYYVGKHIRVMQHNNIVSRSDDEIAAEVKRLRQQYGDDS